VASTSTPSIHANCSRDAKREPPPDGKYAKRAPSGASADYRSGSNPSRSTRTWPWPPPTGRSPKSASTGDPAGGREDAEEAQEHGKSRLFWLHDTSVMAWLQKDTPKAVAY
jgi:hypothetical protein